jgi:hypothetical protein
MKCRQRIAQCRLETRACLGLNENWQTGSGSDQISILSAQVELGPIVKREKKHIFSDHALLATRDWKDFRTNCEQDSSGAGGKG